MVVVSVKAQGGTTHRWRFERTFTIGTRPGSDLSLGTAALIDQVELTIVIADPDVRLDLTGAPSVNLNHWNVDPDFVHVLHVGDTIELADHEILLELVAGTALEVQRVFGEVPTIPDASEAEVLAALRADPADPVAREVYADWLDSHERCAEAELVRLQWLPDGKRVVDPEAFSSEWMSHQPRAIQLRLRDLAQVTDPGRRALASRPAMICRDQTCERRWENLAVLPLDTKRYCARCDQHVDFCSTLDDLSERGTRHHPVAIDPILVHEVAVHAYHHPNDFDEETNPLD